MAYFRLPILTFIALALALWLKADPTGFTAQAEEGRKPNATESGPLASPAAPIELKSLGSGDPYEKLAKILAKKTEEIAWNEVKEALVELNISIPPVSSDLSNQMWKLSNAPAAAKRLAWVKSTDYVVTLNRYMAESHSEDESTFIKANRALRAGTEADESTQKFVTSFRAALAKMPAIAGYTFRGAMLSEEMVTKKYVPGQTVTEDGFTSTSINPSTAYSFAFPKEPGMLRAKVKALDAGDVRVLFIILGKTARPVSYFSEYWAEAEAMFANGTQFQVKAVSAKQADQSRYVVLEEK